MRLEASPDPSLAWTGRHTVFIAEPDGGYQLVRPDDAQLASTPRLEIIDRFGGGRSRRRNLLIHGDALLALRAIRKTRSYSSVVGGVKLAYIDPPFNTHESLTHYDDSLDHGAWLTMMRDRLLEIRELLAPEGSVWAHCDDREQAYLRVLMDEIFGRDSFVATVIWQRKYSRDNRRAIAPVHDYIHVYAPLGHRWKDFRNRLPRRDPPSMWKNPDNDPRGPWSTHSLVAQGGHATRAQFYSITTPAGIVVQPPEGSCWRVTKERFDELVAANEIYFGSHGRNVPRKKVFLSQAKGLVPWTWWPHEDVGHNDEARREARVVCPALPFTTSKPERLLKRIIEVATNPGDIVLDCFLGSGTTAVVATKLQRRWVGVELRRATIDQYVLPRLARVLAEADASGDANSRDREGFSLASLIENGAPARSSHIASRAAAQ